MCAALRAAGGGCAAVQTIQSVTCIRNLSRFAGGSKVQKHRVVIGPACALSCGPAAGSGADPITLTLVAATRTQPLPLPRRGSEG